MITEEEIRRVLIWERNWFRRASMGELARREEREATTAGVSRFIAMRIVLHETADFDDAIFKLSSIQMRFAVMPRHRRAVTEISPRPEQPCGGGISAPFHSALQTIAAHVPAFIYNPLVMIAGILGSFLDHLPVFLGVAHWVPAFLKSSSPTMMPPRIP